MKIIIIYGLKIFMKIIKIVQGYVDYVRCERLSSWHK